MCVRRARCLDFDFVVANDHLCKLSAGKRFSCFLHFALFCFLNIFFREFPVFYLFDCASLLTFFIFYSMRFDRRRFKRTHSNAGHAGKKTNTSQSHRQNA